MRRRIVEGALLLLAATPCAAVAATPTAVALPLRTSGRWIVGSDGKRVKLACINWSGADQKDGIVGGLQHRRVQSIADTFKSMGFNCVRLPWSVWMAVTNPPVPKQWEFQLLAANPELMGKRALDVLDAAVEACARAQLMVVLDNHMSDGDWCCSDLDENGLWYNSRWPEASWQAAHVALARRYLRQPWVVASELRNEVRNSIVGGAWHVPRWGNGSPLAPDWHSAATQAGNLVLSVNPNLLIIVGGLDFGKDVSGAYNLPVQLQLPNRLVYSAHCYTWSYEGLPNKYEALMEQLGRHWGYLVQPGRPFTAPVFVSEFGTFSDCRHGACTQWWPDFLRYLEEGDFDWALWHGDGTYSRNTSPGHPFSAATDYGVLAADWQTPANGGELLDAVKTVQRATMGPGVVAPQCDERCADSFRAGWGSGRMDAAACSTCLRSKHCRKNVTMEEWCAEGWSTHGCGWTCCRAGLLEADKCSAGRCAESYADSWYPQWPSGKVNSEACLHCLRDPLCRHSKSEEEWCTSTWSSFHCEKTCCSAGYRDPLVFKVERSDVFL